VVEKNWKLPSNISIEALMGKLRGEYSEPVLIELYVGADDKNSSINILQVNPYPAPRHSKPSQACWLSQRNRELRKFMGAFCIFHFTAGSASFGIAKSRLLSEAEQ
jgi:membrane metallo-endopeptidase-like protein 1